LALGYIHMLQGNSAAATDELRRATAGDDEHAGTESMGRAEVARLMLIAATGMQGDHDAARRLFDAYNEVWLHRTVWRFGAMFTKADALFPGTQALLNALAEAGMPLAADEHHDDGGAIVPCPGGQFDPTPLTLPGAITLDTQAVASTMRAEPTTILIDLSEGSSSPVQAVWYNYVTEREQPTDFVRRVAKAHSPYSKDEPIIVMGSGTYGCRSEDAVSALVGDGYTHVGWYRGGEEAWARAGLAGVDRRPG
jgi:rhodanese-related sulfurtransferase